MSIIRRKHRRRVLQIAGGGGGLRGSPTPLSPTPNDHAKNRQPRGLYIFRVPFRKKVAVGLRSLLRYVLFRFASQKFGFTSLSSVARFFQGSVGIFIFFFSDPFRQVALRHPKHRFNPPSAVPLRGVMSYGRFAKLRMIKKRPKICFQMTKVPLR